MTFNADEYLKTLTPPSIVIGGVTYTGKLLSLDALIPFQEQALRIDQGKASVQEIRDIAAAMCDAMDLPTEKILALPYTVMLVAVADFLVSHGVVFATPLSTN